MWQTGTINIKYTTALGLSLDINKQILVIYQYFVSIFKNQLPDWEEIMWYQIRVDLSEERHFFTNLPQGEFFNISCVFKENMQMTFVFSALHAPVASYVKSNVICPQFCIVLHVNVYETTPECLTCGGGDRRRARDWVCGKCVGPPYTPGSWPETPSPRTTNTS